MRLNPLDIYNKEFKKGFRVWSYNPEEVDEFIEQLSSDYEKLFNEVVRLRKENKGLQEELQRYKEQEEELRSSLLSAQRTYAQVKEEAEREGQAIIQEARQKAEELIQQGTKKIQERFGQYKRLQEMEELFRIRFRTLLESQLKDLNQLEEEIAENEESDDDEEQPQGT